jgi:hypothetical protein
VEGGGKLGGGLIGTDEFFIYSLFLSIQTNMYLLIDQLTLKKPQGY